MRIHGPAGLAISRLRSASGLLWPAAVLGFLLLISPGQAQKKQKVWESGAYSFSDELGGFRIRGVSGKGTRADPIVLEEELNSASPVTLTIRTIKPIQPFDSTGDYASGIIYMRINALNSSGHAWAEFQFELQEVLDQPSVFGDGLSFDQRNKTPENIASSNFTTFDRNFEPYDRLLFTRGKVDPLETAEFEFLITDYTPRWTFYLMQDPRIPSS